MAKVQKREGKNINKIIDLCTYVRQTTRFESVNRTFLELKSIKSKIKKIPPHHKTR